MHIDHILTVAVRAWLYRVFTAIFALLITYGVVGGAQSGQWLGLVAAILGFANAGVASAYTPRDGNLQAPQHEARKEKSKHALDEKE